MKIPAVRVKQPLGDFWAVSIPARTLLACASLDPTRISHVDKTSFLYKLMGNQREASASRAREIGLYINSEDAAFPNSIIIGANYTESGPLEDDSSDRWTLLQGECGFFIEIPSSNKSIVVIDGQHRLLGFDYASDQRRDMELLCAVYFDLPQSYQAYLFATININQRKVDKSLAYEQFGYNLDHEKAEGWAPEKVAVYVSRKLNLDPSSPLYGKIKLAPLDGEKVFSDDDITWQVSTACIVEGVLSLISTKPRQDRDSLHAKPIPVRNRASLGQDSSPFRDLYRKSEDEKLLGILRDYFSLAKEYFWANANSASYIRKTVGVQALFDVLRHVGLRYDQQRIPAETRRILSASAKIDFSHQFFQASGKGRVRVKNVILRAAKELTAGDLPPSDIGAYAVFAQETGAFRNA